MEISIMDCSPTLLIVDDEYSVYFALSTCLDEKITIHHAPNGIETLSLLSKKSMDLVLLDYQLLGMNGIELLKIIKQDYPIPVFFFTGYPSDELTAQLQQLENGPDGYFTKPLDMPTFERAIAEYVKPKPSDKALIQAFVAGDKDAYDILHKRYYQFVYKFALKKSKNEQQAQDIAQNTFEKLIECSRSFHPKAKLSTWLCKVALNECLNLIKRNKLVTGQEEYLLNVQDNAPDAIINIMANKELARIVMSQLPQKYRKILKYRYYDGLSLPQIAQKTGKKKQSIKNDFTQAKKEIEIIIKENEKF